MENEVFTFKLNLDWELIETISRIDRFDASWSAIEKKEGNSLKQLKTVATIRSVGASTRIEGSKMSNKEVEVLLKNIDISKMEDRDSQEVIGYFNALDLISESYKDIEITEGDIKNLHNVLLKYSKKDSWHKGEYKQQSNIVEATYADGTKQTVFQTTEPGFATNEAMKSLVRWYQNDNKTHSLVKCALFTYELLSIHPFQDGNGRLSRLISTLLLLKQGYLWIQYVSFENEIENKKTEYYRVLQNCQQNRPNENVDAWVNFFLNSLVQIQDQLMKKLEISGVETNLAPRERSMIVFIGNNPGCRSGEIAEKLGIPNPTVKRILPELLKQNLIEKHGNGPGTNYTLV